MRQQTDRKEDHRLCFEKGGMVFPIGAGDILGCNIILEKKRMRHNMKGGAGGGLRRIVDFWPAKSVKLFYIAGNVESHSYGFHKRIASIL